MKKSTQSVHSGTYQDPQTGGVNTPIFTSTAYHYEPNGFIPYPRYFNTINQDVIGKKVAALENAEAGLVFASGMAAIMSSLLAILKTGDHLILQNDIYGGTHYAVREQLQRLGIECTFVEGRKASDFEKAVQPNSKAIYIETPSNPLLLLVDMEEIADVAKKNKLISLIDNTFGTPIHQNPIDFGIDIVIHSGTKYLAGHSDISCGAVVASKELIEKIHRVAFNFGGNLDNTACYLLERSLKTLAIRVKTQSENARRLAEYLHTHEAVKQVFYPSLPTHPDNHIAKKQMKDGFGAMLSFELNTDEEGKKQFLESLQFVSKALSLGGVESTVTEPCYTSHSKVPREERLKMGVSDGLLRLSVGIEDSEDLLQDFEQALSKIKIIEHVK